MAERRMFAKSIVLSDAFLDMPLSARCLYFTLGMLADDDGFVGNPKGVMRQCGASQDDMSVLLQKRFVLAFESGVIVIKHWRMNNYLQSDRKKTTTYIEELSQLKIDEKGAYTEKNKGMYTECIQNVYTGKNSIDKNSIDKVSINNPPISPTGERNFDNYSNTANYLFVQETSKEEYVNYIHNHDELDRCVTGWMEYKDERKPKSSNRYGKKGMNTLLNKIYTECLEYGIDEMIRVIEESMSSNYQGIIWDKLNDRPKKESTYDAWAKA